MADTFERQMLLIQDRVELRRLVDEMGDDSLAVLISQHKDESGEVLLSVRTLGHGKKTEFAGMLVYADSIMRYRYFIEDD